MRYTFLIAVIVASLILPVGASSSTGDITNDPTGIVKKFLRLDSKGARLDPAGPEVFQPYVAWEEEPIWDTVVVIEGYQVLEETKDWNIISMLEVVIPVEYRVLGTMVWKTATFERSERLERVGFHVKAHGLRWRVVAPQVPPHVGLTRMINRVRYAILQEKDPKRRETLIALRDDLKKAQ